MKYQHKITDVIIKIISGEDLTAAEQNLYDKFITDKENQKIVENLKDKDYLDSELANAHKFDIERVRQKIENKTRVITIGKRVTWYRYAAAILIMMMATAAFWLLNKKHEKAKVEQPVAKIYKDLPPGKAGATLKLANGKTIVLDNLGNGAIAFQGSTQVLNKEGRLIYEGNNNSEVLYNTISTARGQTFPVVLSDNSRIWLNSESSIRFPVSFTGGQRKVEITGQVYFEIGEDASKPFIISANGIEVQVLGTAFDIKSYNGQAAINTTLLNGSVKVKKGTRQVILKPGQQAQATEDQIKVKNNIPVDQVIAWKNGFIYMNNEKLSEIMMDVARWYNIDVVYKENTKDVEMMGRINRNANLSEFIKLLSASNIDAQLDGNKLTLKVK